MGKAYGQHIMIDFYSCYEESINDTKNLIDIVATALESVEHPIDEITCREYDDEIILGTMSQGMHINIHTYPDIGYVAVDVYAFKQEWKVTALTKLLKEAFGAERVKATTLQRADFGNIADMKPRYKTTLSAKGRVKQTGTKLKRTGLNVLRIIRKRKAH